MDSAANSGSIQSSSGGDDNYDPRAAADSSFITPTFNPFSPPPHLQTMYNYNPYNNNHNNSSNFLNQQSQTISLPPPHHDHFTAPPSPQPLDQDHTVQVAPNPKKRSRASRRAPTTVLTTDTSNFRAMVQEFTGITPSPSSSSSNSSHVINLRNKLQFSHQTLLLRPQKLLRPSYNNYNNMLNYYTNNNNNNNNNNILSSPLFSDTSQQLHNPNIQSLQSSSHNIIREEYGRCNNVTGGLPELISPENGNNYSENATIMKHNFSNLAPATTNFEQGAKRMRESLSVSATRGTNYIITSEGLQIN